tara:strand:- start:196 stop:489 length:294 start_codon:yes stop_codon:yes gene_type:complete
MIVYYIILIFKLFTNNNIQNQFIRFSLRNIYQNYKHKFKKKSFYKNFLNVFYTTKFNNDINYEDLNNYITIFLKNNSNINSNNNNLIKDKIIKNYLD